MWLVFDMIWGIYLLWMSYYDLKRSYILGGHIVVAAVIWCASFVVLGVNQGNMIYGMLLGGVIFLISYITQESVGMGDCWIILFLAVYVGLVDALYILIFSFMGAAVVALVNYLIQKNREGNTQLRNKELPFLPFLCLGYSHCITRKYKAVFTIEIAYIMPIIILLLSGIVLSGFYLHDKNILYSKVYELGSIARQEYRMPQETMTSELEEVLVSGCKGKMLLFDSVTCYVERSGSEISITGEMEFRGKKVAVTRVFGLNDTEKNIRTIRPVV